MESKELRPGTKPEDKSDGGCGVRHAEGVEQNQSRVSYYEIQLQVGGIYTTKLVQWRRDLEKIRRRRIWRMMAE